MDNLDFTPFSISGGNKWSHRIHLSLESKGKEMEIRTKGEDYFTEKSLFCKLVGQEHWGRF